MTGTDMCMRRPKVGLYKLQTLRLFLWQQEINGVLFADKITF